MNGGSCYEGRRLLLPRAAVVVIWYWRWEIFWYLKAVIIIGISGRRYNATRLQGYNASRYKIQGNGTVSNIQAAQGSYTCKGPTRVRIYININI